MSVLGSMLHPGQMRPVGKETRRARMKGLSPKQKQVLEILENAVREGQHLTVREIGDLIGVSSTCTVHQHLKALERKGYLKPTNHRHRSIQLTSPPRPFVPVPFGGDVVAGDATAPETTMPDTVMLPSDLVGQDSSVFYRVLGDGMSAAAIRDGDLVVVVPGQAPQSGDVVIAQGHESATINQVVDENGSLCIKSGDLATPVLPDNGVSILGRVSIVIRRL